MSNELQDLMDTQIMPAALPVLREACVMPALVATDFQGVAEEQNAVIRVPLPPDLGEADDMDVDTGSSETDLKPGKVEIVLDKWRYKSFKMTDKEMRETLTGGVLPEAAQAAIKVLANDVNKELWALYKDIPYHGGTAGVVPSSKASIIAQRKLLQDNLCPPGDRRYVMNTETEAEYLELFSDADKTGSTEALRKASLGELFGFEAFSDQISAYHTFGSFAAGAPLVNGAVAAGATVMNIDGGAGTETIKKGDCFTVATVKNAKGDPMQFVFTGDGIAVGGAIVGAQFYPAAPAGGLPNDAAITIVKPASGTQYGVNLAFHRNAFMFAARALANEQSENSTISVAQDPITGIPLRLETWREPRKATRFWRFDILYGVKTLRREFASRQHG